MNLANLGLCDGKYWLGKDGSCTGVTVYVYEKGQMTIPSKTALYGSDVKMFQIPENKYSSYEYKYRIIQDELITLDQPAQRCHDDSNDIPCSVSKCIAEYLEANFNCSLYLLDSPGKREDCTKDIKFQNIFYEWEMKSELEIYRTTGCMSSCKRQQIRLETEQVIKTTNVTNEQMNIQVMLQYRDGTYNLNEEYLVYDFNNFIADIGGYLGLLLGHSILSVYTMSADWITKPLRNIQNWLYPTNMKKEKKAVAAKK